MAINLPEEALQKEIEKNQPNFNQMIEAGQTLAGSWIINHWEDIRKAPGLLDVKASNLWAEFINSNYYKLYNEIIKPYSVSGIEKPGEAFKIFISAFDTFKDHPNFSRKKLIKYLNDSFSKHYIQNLNFNYTGDILADDPDETLVSAETITREIDKTLDELEDVLKDIPHEELTEEEHSKLLEVHTATDSIQQGSPTPESIETLHQLAHNLQEGRDHFKILARILLSLAALLALAAGITLALPIHAGVGCAFAAASIVSLSGSGICFFKSREATEQYEEAQLNGAQSLVH